MLPILSIQCEGLSTYQNAVAELPGGAQLTCSVYSSTLFLVVFDTWHKGDKTVLIINVGSGKKESWDVGIGDIRLHKLLFCTYPVAVPMNIYRFTIDMCAETQVWLRVMYCFLLDVNQNWKLPTYFLNIH